jgi:transposase-like protein
MKITLVIPPVKLQPSLRPQHCPHCGHWRLHRHGTVPKRVRDHQVEQVVAERYRCTGCGRTFRHYPAGVSRAQQSQRLVVLATLLWGFGLSCRAAALLLSAFGTSLERMSVWRDVQAVGTALRRRRLPAGTVRVLGADETVYRVRGREAVVGFVVDDLSGQTLGVELLVHRDAATVRAWLEPYVEALGVEVVVTDEQRSYGVVAAALGLEHQLCLAHVRKAVTKRVRAIGEQAQREWEWDDPAALAQLATDLAQIRTLVRELPPTGAEELGELQRRYQGSPQPGAGEQATAGYRMRLLTLELWEHWPKLRLFQTRPELGLDGTNNATERAIGKSKVRAKTVRGYKSLDGLQNGIALTQALYAGTPTLDLAQALVG